MCTRNMTARWFGYVRGAALILAMVLWECDPIMAQGSGQMLTLEDAIACARRQSVASAVARNKLRAAYWRYRVSRANLLPEVSIGGTLPHYKRLFNLHQGADGSYTFVRSNVLQANGELAVTQRIPLTGGTVSLQSSLDVLHPLGRRVQDRYLAVPLGVTLTQPLFAANLMRWENRIEPVRYREQQAAYLSEVEELTREAISRYFDLLVAETRLSSARQNAINTRKLYAIAQAKRQNGDLSANGERQLLLSLLEAQSALTEEETSWRASLFALQSFLGLPDSDSLRVVMPVAVPVVSVPYDTVLACALENNVLRHRAARMRLEANQVVAVAKGERFKVDLVASVGYTGQDANLMGSYSQPIDYQEVRLGFRIPILDWGRRAGKLKMAQWDREVVESQLRQQEQLFRQELFILVERFNRQQAQLRLAQEADTVAELRYQTSIAVFIEGRIGTLELNDAQLSKDRARERRIQQLRRFWDYFYRIRGLTLHDFSGVYPIDRELEQVIR